MIPSNLLRFPPAQHLAAMVQFCLDERNNSEQPQADFLFLSLTVPNRTSWAILLSSASAYRHAMRASILQTPAFCPTKEKDTLTAVTVRIDRRLLG